jgi:hypothetical protein
MRQIYQEDKLKKDNSGYTFKVFYNGIRRTVFPEKKCLPMKLCIFNMIIDDIGYILDTGYANRR